MHELAGGSRSARSSCRTQLIAAFGASLAFLSACSSFGPTPIETDTTAAPGATPAPVAARDRILVLRASDAESYTDIAVSLDALLGERFELEQASLAQSTAASIADHGADAWSAAIAIGADAADAVDTELGVPTVFCQIVDYGSLLEVRDTLFGVEALPPLDLQLKSWKQLAPHVTSVGALIAEDDVGLADQARQAAAANGIELHVEFASTDREALYRFRRLAASVDGIWLLPSSGILSPRVLREMLDYARSRQIYSIVFDDALLGWGASLSVGSDSTDVAATVSRVVEALVRGEAPELDRVTPLTAVDLRINPELAIGLGVVAPAEESQVYSSR